MPLVQLTPLFNEIKMTDCNCLLHDLLHSFSEGFVQLKRLDFNTIPIHHTGLFFISFRSSFH